MATARRFCCAFSSPTLSSCLHIIENCGSRASVAPGCLASPRSDYTRARSREFVDFVPWSLTVAAPLFPAMEVCLQSTGHAEERQRVSDTADHQTASSWLVENEPLQPLHKTYGSCVREPAKTRPTWSFPDENFRLSRMNGCVSSLSPIFLYCINVVLVAL